MKGSIWERGIRWPRSGPLFWASSYVLIMVGAGFLFWQGLTVFSPREPNVSTGHVYRVPGSRRMPEIYVTRGEAYVLRVAGAHLILLVVVGGAIGFFNMGATPEARAEIARHNNGGADQTPPDLRK